MRAASGDHDLPALPIMVHAVAGNDGASKLRNLLRIRQPACARIGTGQAAVGGLHDSNSATAQRSHVVLGCRVKPHLRVHRWGDNHRTRRNEDRRAEKIVCATTSQTRDQVRGCRGNNDGIRLLA